MTEGLSEQPKRPMPPAVWIGIGVTVIWTIAIGMYSFRNWEVIVAQPPNSLGDMLAGATAPLAFLWLVVATFLQRQELELQRSELTLTRSEHKAARDVFTAQQKEMAVSSEQSRNQADAQISSLKLSIAQKEIELFEESIYTLSLLISNTSSHFTILFNDTSSQSWIKHHTVISVAQTEKTNRDNFEFVLIFVGSNIMSFKVSFDEFLRQKSQGVFLKNELAHSAALQYITICDFILSKLESNKENPTISIRINALRIIELVEFLKYSSEIIRNAEFYRP